MGNKQVTNNNNKKENENVSSNLHSLSKEQKRKNVNDYIDNLHIKIIKSSKFIVKDSNYNHKREIAIDYFNYLNDCHKKDYTKGLHFEKAKFNEQLNKNYPNQFLNNFIPNLIHKLCKENIRKILKIELVSPIYENKNIILSEGKKEKKIPNDEIKENILNEFDIIANSLMLSIDLEKDLDKNNCKNCNFEDQFEIGDEFEQKKIFKYFGEEGHIVLENKNTKDISNSEVSRKDSSNFNSEIYNNTDVTKNKILINKTLKNKPLNIKIDIRPYLKTDEHETEYKILKLPTSYNNISKNNIGKQDTSHIQEVKTMSIKQLKYLHK
jgi:hypothetical protein